MCFKVLVQASKANFCGARFDLLWDVGGALEEDYGPRDGGHGASVAPGGDPLNGEAA